MNRGGRDVGDWGLGQAPVQYGTGASYQASCPPFPAPPAGYNAWSAYTNGPIPSDIQAKATALSNDMTKPLGYTETVYAGGVPLLLRVDPHTWTTDAQGNAVAGCLHGVGVYVPSPSSLPPAGATQSGQTTSNTLLVISIGLGAVVSALSIIEYFRKPKA